jgi:hypothetical protein
VDAGVLVGGVVLDLELGVFELVALGREFGRSVVGLALGFRTIRIAGHTDEHRAVDMIRTRDFVTAPSLSGVRLNRR